MKYLILSISLLISLGSCGQGHGDGHGHLGKALEVSDFKSEKIAKTATIILNGNIENVFPLFNPIEEQKWAPVFKPHFIFPSDESVQEGMSFKTAGHGDEPEFLWVITKYNKEDHLIQYLVSTSNRYWTITVACKQAGDDLAQTSAEITYAYFGLNEKGLTLNKMHLDRMYAKSLKDWEEAINNYLKS